MYEEFPHLATIYKMGEACEDDSGGFVEGGPVDLFTMYCFVDTPSSQELYNAMQLQNSFDRYIYYPSDYKLLNEHFVRYEGIEYEQIGKPLDQGGQAEIFRVKVREVKK